MKLRGLAALYMQSPEWGALKPNSRKMYLYGMAKLERFMKMDADDITRPMVIDLKDELYNTPGVCKAVISVLNNILAFGYDRGHVKYNHAAGIKRMPKQKPYKKWSDDEVERFLLNSPTHLKRAVMLALYTGQRRVDLVRLRWDQYDGNYIHLVQAKTGKELVIPVHPELKAELDQMKSERVFGKFAGRTVVPPYILLNGQNDPWSLHHLTWSVTKQARKLNIMDRQLHGLRKTTAAKLAEIGCTPHEIAAITGQSLQEVERYTKEASQKRMATSAMARWEEDGRTASTT